MFPPEIINHIFSYCQGYTNQIMKQHIKYAKHFETGVIGLFRLNRDYGFKHFNIKHLHQAISCRCSSCKITLWPNEYKRNINYDGQKMCSRSCLIEYQVLLSMNHSSY